MLEFHNAPFSTDVTEATGLDQGVRAGWTHAKRRLAVDAEHVHRIGVHLRRVAHLGKVVEDALRRCVFLRSTGHPPLPLGVAQGQQSVGVGLGLVRVIVDELPIRFLAPADDARGEQDDGQQHGGDANGDEARHGDAQWPLASEEGPHASGFGGEGVQHLARVDGGRGGVEVRDRPCGRRGCSSEQPVDQFLLPAGNGQALLAQPLFELGHVEHRKVLVHALWSSRGFIKAVVPCVAGRRLCSAQISSPVHRCPRRCSMLS